MSLGWCAESAQLPRKQRYINGISSATMVGLRAQMARARENQAQQHLKTTKGTIGKGINQILKNKGVDDRNARDVAEAARSSDVAGRLQEKAALYARLAREGDRDGGEGTVVDFERKAMEGWEPEAREAPATPQYDAAGKRQRAWTMSWMDEDLEEERRARVRRLLEEVCDETARAREQVLRLREQKRAKDRRRLAMLKERHKLRRQGLQQEQQEDIISKLYEAIKTQEESEESEAEDLPPAAEFLARILAASSATAADDASDSPPPPPPTDAPPPPPPASPPPSPPPSPADP